MSARNASTSSGVGGKPVKSSVTRRINAALVASRAGKIPSLSILASTNASIALRTRAASRTRGTAGRTGATNAQCCCHDAPPAIHARIVATSAALVEAEATVTALELDRHVLPLLAAVLEGTGRPDLVRVVQGDALTVDLDDLVGPDPIACVSNLPYNVATPIVMRILDEVPQVERLLVMVQREVGERMAAPVGGREYGAVSVKKIGRAHV